MRIEVIPFRNNHLDEAAALLARRHRRDRIAERALPERFEDVTVARSALETTWNKPGANGVVALHKGRMIGYLVAIPKHDDATWGRSMWVNLAAHAIDEEYGAELYRDLYAAASSDWVASGHFSHYTLMPASDRSGLDAWFALSFGQEQAYGIRETTQEERSSVSANPNLEIRRATPADKEGVLRVIDIVRRHQSRSPVYGAILPEQLQNLSSDVDELLADSTLTLWLALRDEHVVGFQLYEPALSEPDSLYIPEPCIELALAATKEDEQGHGIGRALTEHTIAWAQAEGYTHCVADWRVTNLLSSRFWPRQGFRHVMYRLSRRIDERITWASSKR